MIVDNASKPQIGMQSGFDYYAFVSYKREDEVWAKWLQKKLEGYNIPSAIRKEIPRIPKHVRPIFRDKTDLGVGGLTASLHSELERSRYLIVICSPHSAKSEWVGKEIEHFIHLGREKDVIPFIVDGIPHSGNPQTECFNPVFEKFEDEPLGINVQEIGRNRALVKVLAKMLELRFDTLWDRHRRDLRKRKALSVAACGFAAVLGLAYWEYSKPTYEYYADYVDKWGVPEGVIQLDKRQIRHKQDMYRFEYRRVPIGQPGAFSWRLSQVALVNSAGTVVNHHNSEMIERTSIIEIEYGKNSGEVMQVNQCDRTGRVLMRSKISSGSGVRASLIDLQGSADGEASGYLGASTSSMSSHVFSAENGRTSIKRYALTRDSDGHITRRTYHASNDDNLKQSAMSDADGIFGVDYTLDSLGRVLEIKYLGYDYRPCVTRKGIAGRSYRYDVLGNLSRAEYFGQDGFPVMNEELWAICEDVFDDNGNLAEERVFDSEGQPCLSSYGFSKWTAKYDSRGNEIEHSYYGLDGQPCLHTDGYAKWMSKYDDRGNRVEILFCDTDDHPCLRTGCYAKFISKFDDRGNIVEESYYGTDGQPCLISGGYTKITLKYDDRGNNIECSYYGIDGQPCLHSDGYTKITLKYDDRGNEIECLFYGPDGQPCLIFNGFAKKTSKYDDRGNKVEESYYGTDGRPCLISDGYAKVTYKYDDRGNKIECSFYGPDGQPCMHFDGCYAKWTAKYDSRGNKIEYSYYGIDGQPCLHTDGNAKVTFKYNDKGNEIECSFYGLDGQPCLISYGFAKWTAKYDDRGNKIEYSFYGLDGQPCLHTDGNAKVTFKYDDKGNEIERSYYGLDGQPCLISYGLAKNTSKYDSRGNRVEVLNFGADGNPCLDHEGKYKVNYQFDERGLTTDCYSYGTDGEPVMNSFGFWRFEMKYNEWGLMTSRTTYDINNQPCISSFGYCTIELEYDDLMQIVSTSYFDENGNRMSKTYSTMRLVTTSNSDGISGDFLNSFVIRWNGWQVGDPVDELQRVMKSSKYGEKHLVLLDVDGMAHEIIIPSRKLNSNFVESAMPEETYGIAKARLDSIAKVGTKYR